VIRPASPAAMARAERFYRRYGFDKVADITFRVGDHIDPEFLFAQVF
jgi:hypothetical protein